MIIYYLYWKENLLRRKKKRFRGKKGKKKKNAKTSFARSETEIPSVFTFPVCYYVRKYLVFGGRSQRLGRKRQKCTSALCIHHGRTLTFSLFSSGRTRYRTNYASKNTVSNVDRRRRSANGDKRRTTINDPKYSADASSLRKWIMVGFARKNRYVSGFFFFWLL